MTDAHGRRNLATMRPLAAALFAALVFAPVGTHADVTTTTSTGAQTATLGDDEIARLVRFRIDRQKRATAAVIGVLRPSGRSIVAYRTPRSASEVEPRGDTVFEIASLTKIFTALLLADAVARGEVRLDDPLATYVPTGVLVPTFSGQSIALADLATHTSGLPLRPNNLYALPDAPNKYAGYTREQLYDGLGLMQLERAPGSQFEYSNLGFALLGHALAVRAREPYAELLRRRIVAPLGLADTGLDDEPAARPRRAQGHDVDLRPIGPSSNGALSPAGGLRSTANDLLTFLELFVRGTGPEPLPQAARSMLDVERPGDGPDTHIALGWRRTVAHGETYYWSHGSSDGSRTFMGFNAARGVAVVALADAASGGGLDDIGRRILDPGESVDLKIVPRPRIVDLPSDAVDRVLGTYRYAPDDEMTVTRGATGLIVTAGTSQFLVKPASRTRFVAPDAGDLYLEFPGPRTARASRMVLHQDGKQWTYARVSTAPARPGGEGITR